MKKLLIFIIAICLATGLCACTSGNGTQTEASATDGTSAEAVTGEHVTLAAETAGEHSPITSGDFTYTTLADGTAQIEAYMSDGTSVTIPSEIDGCTVTAIAPMAFSKAAYVTEITIPDTVTTVGVQAFDDTEWYKNQQKTEFIIIGDSVLIGFNLIGDTYEAAIPDGVKYISAAAFSYYQVATVRIPASVISIDKAALADCCMNNIYVDAANEHYCDVDGVLFSKDKKTLVQCPYKSAMSYEIPDGTEIIGYGALYECESLTSLTIPDGVVEIDSLAFAKCASLNEISLPASLEAIHESVFYGCDKLMKINFEGSANEWTRLPISETTLSQIDLMGIEVSFAK